MRAKSIWSIAIITYQVITGNYSSSITRSIEPSIITYQVITGNYSIKQQYIQYLLIITYQVITGNYSGVDGFLTV